MRRGFERSYGNSPAFAVLHVGVGTGLEQSLGDAGHAAHHLVAVLLGAEGAHQVEGRLHRPHRGRVHLGRVADQEGGGELVAWVGWGE